MIQNTNIRRKLEVARQELLDLGLRNPLLNYRTLKARGLEVIRERSEDVYRILVTDRKKMSFLEAMRETGSQQLTVHSTIVDTTNDELVSVENYADTKLQTNYSEKQLEQRLLNTYYAARTYIEEQGVNILFIAFGMLQWYESTVSQEARKAPLILVPVQLERVSAKERFKLSYTEDEIGHNISLVAKMKTEYGIEIPGLPESDEIAIGDYFNSVARAIEGQSRWTIDRDSIVIGFFSFGKFLMYRDLDVEIWPDQVRPEQHPILTALLEEGFREPASFVGDNDHVDQYFRMSEVSHIMDADSSQITAILDAKQGRNMVIQGPPGTGKSQTITNLIAEAIADGKKVLFVSEKMAALEVVKRRLDSVGLGVACLELHSHKTNKKTLLNELASTLELGKPKYKNNVSIELLEDMRNRLNEYSSAMNTEVGQSGVTPHQAIGELVRIQDSLKDVQLPKVEVEAMHQWTDSDFNRREALIEELQKLLQTMGIPSQHAFWGSKKKVVLPAEMDSIKETCTEAIQITNKLVSAVEAYAKEVNFPSVPSPRDTQLFVQVLHKTIGSPDLIDIQLSSDLWLKNRKELEMMADNGMAYTQIRKKFDSQLIPEAWSQDLLAARQSIATYQGKWWRFLSSEYRQAKNRMIALRKNPKDHSVSLLDTIDAIMKARRLKDTLESQRSMAEELFPALWKGADSRWNEITNAIQWVVNLHAEVHVGKLPEWILTFLTYAPDKLRLTKIVQDVEILISEFHVRINKLEQQLEFDNQLKFGGSKFNEQAYDSIIRLMNLWQERLPELHEMASYNHLRAVCADEQLEPYITLIQEWEMASEHVVECYRWNWFTSIVSRAFSERSALSGFDGSRHNQAVLKFQELDQAHSEFNRIRLADLHWNKLPKHEAGGQLGVLLREFEKKTRHLPIRQLINRAGHAIQAIKPVFMMGPLSISTYIEPGSLEFDLVIFDEASQVKPVDAFGAIIRAKQAIVVGDSKQMPPTNFFDSLAKEEDDEEEENFVADMESILGLFAGQNAPQRMLRWHYRSRHESLISVSNHEFYDNKLVVFPSPDSDTAQLGLRFHYLPHSHYDRGRTRTNKLEAKAVAAAVIEHAKKRPDLSLGVAAFSTAQMQAILDELEVLRRSDPSTESFFSAHPFEPFFVKNLENVQGDEREVIFISIGYGKTAEGYLAMEFGPLNREGGERRLNVLISRAKQRCEVFTNLKSEDIDLNRTKARGVKALKTFLRYAEHGILDIPVETGKDFDSVFEEAVCKALQNLGYQVKQQVGSAGFFIDLAVVDSDSPGRYLLGIECDGATYHSARSARDRDRLRQAVLEGLGWTIHRIWSTDWFKNPDRELKRVVEAIDRAQILSKAQQHHKQDSNEIHEISREESPEEWQAPQVNHYQIAKLNINLGDKEFHMLSPALIASWISQVVRVEGPVHISEVMKRICDAAGIKRVGSRIHETIVRSCKLLYDVRQKGDFLWHKDMKVPIVRYRGDLKINKKIQLVVPEEIALAIIKAVKESFGADEDAIASSVAQQLGFARITEEMKGVIIPTINSLVEDKILVRNGMVLVLA